MPEEVKPAVPVVAAKPVAPVAKPAAPVVAAKPAVAVAAKPVAPVTKASAKGDIEAELKLIKDPNRTSDMHRISAEKIEKLLASL